MAAAAEIDTFLFDTSEAVQAYAAGQHDAALLAAPAPAVPRPIWAQAPEAVEQLLAGAILRTTRRYGRRAGRRVADHRAGTERPRRGGTTRVRPHVCCWHYAFDARLGATLCSRVSAAGWAARVRRDGRRRADHGRFRVQRQPAPPRSGLVAGLVRRPHGRPG
eukprot:1965355-Prymnesium_polylepis.1